MNCNTRKCKSECCGIVPIPNKVIDFYHSKINKKAIILPAGDSDSVVFVESSLRCGFLNPDQGCEIYKYRPEVCRLFGEKGNTNPLLKCPRLGQITEDDKTFIDKKFKSMGIK